VTSAVELRSDSPQRTLQVGAVLGGLLRGGEVVELCGPLGSGKTVFAKGLAAGLGAAPDEPVVSPTFVLVRTYVGRLTLHHCDAYRLGCVEELHALGLQEALDQGGCVIAIEWADRFPNALAAPTLRVDLCHEDEHSRGLRIRCDSAALAAELTRRLGAASGVPGCRT